MKICEFTNPSAAPDSENNLATALTLLRQRFQDLRINPPVSTNALINLVVNTGLNFDYAALCRAVVNNPAVKNQIKTFNKKQVHLVPADEQSNDSDSPKTASSNADAVAGIGNDVSDMAKRAAKQRGAALP